MDASGHSLPRELKKFRMLYDLAIAMTAEQSMEENLQLVVEKSRELLKTETAYIAVRDEARGDVYMHSLSGVRTEAFKKMRLPFGKGLWGFVAETGQGIIVEDYLEDKRITHVIDKIVAEEGVVSGVAVPVQIGKTNLGALYAFNRVRTSFSQADLETLHMIGNLAAVEISRKRAEDAVRQNRIELEQKVAARASDLLKANRLLEQEIQQRKKAEEMIRESEERIRTIIEHSNELFYVHDLQHQYSYVSPQCEAITGYTPDEIKGKWTELFTENPINRKGFDLTERALRTGRRQPPYILECKRKDGHLILFEVDESPLKDSDGNVVGVVGAARDVTERKRSEDALQAAERKYRSIFENAVEGMFQSTVDGSFAAVNPALARMFGYDSTGELMAELKNIRTQLYEDPARRDEFIEILRQKGEVRNFEAEVCRKDGRAIMTCINARQVRDEKGNALCIEGCVEDITERKVADEALKESEQRYRKLVENLPIGIYRSTPGEKGRFVMANPAFLHMFGFKSEEELRQTCVSDIYMDPGERKQFSNELLARNSVIMRNRYLRKKDGTPLWGTLTARVAYQEGDENGEAYFDCAIEDVTEMKLAEQKLLESERRYRELVEGSRDGYALTDMSGRIVETNTSFRKMLGYTEEEMRKLDYRGITPEKWYAVEAEMVASQLLTRGYTEVFEKEYLRKDGTVFPAETRIYLVKEGKGEKGRGMGAWALIRDITERKRAEQAIRENEKKFLDLFDNVSDFIYFHDMDGNLVETNLAFRKAYGIKDNPSATINIRDLMPEENRPLFAQYMERVLVHGQDEGFMKVRSPHGREVLVEYKNAVVRDAEGNVVGVRGSARDVTDRVRAEKEKKRLRAQIMSAQRIEAIGTLAGGIAHNFNNLLMGIQGNATLARLEVDQSSPVSRKLENIEKLVKSGAKLTSQLLGYARGGRYEVRPVSLNDLIKEISNTFAQARKDITVQLDLSESLKRVEADQGQVEQAVLNLLVNAADAMPSGGKVILRTRNVTHEAMNGKPYKPKTGKYVLLEVQDFGIGMDKKTMERIFEPFFTTKGMGKGTGLGLASVYGIVKGHGGYIDVASQEQKGSTFQIYLPASEKKIVKEKELPKGVVMGSGTILLVDDEQMILEVGKGMLETLGYTVLASGGGREAIEIYAGNHEKIDLVVLDLVMPGMSGRETFEQLKSINPGVRVLLSSGFSIDTLAKEMLEHGCDGFIQKPLFIEEFSQEIAKILSRR
jgi:PAS domain S-box-containing protein